MTDPELHTEGVKYDDHKSRMDLIPPEALEALAALYTLGARKYDDHNWRKGMKWSRVYSAMIRHANAWWGGETHDNEDGQHHLISVAWCAFALFIYQMTQVGEDDRYL